MRYAYVVVSYLLTPVIVFFLLVRGLKNHAYWRHLPERFGFICSTTRPTIWVHAVSMGEVHAAEPLIKMLLAEYSDYRVMVTTVTPSGRERARAIFSDQIDLHYVPYDLVGAVRRFFKRAQPKLVIILETELWPNLYHECGRQKVPLVLASARISPNSVRRYRWFVSLFKETLSHGIVIAAQSELDAQRFKSLGANTNRTHVIGNIKFDIAMNDSVREQGLAFREQFAGERPVWLAASTHEGEEQQLVSVWRAVKQAIPNHLWILVPRHPERFDKVINELRAEGLNVVTRTSGAPVHSAVDALVVNTLGELNAFYAASDVAFVAGSLVPIGGHNLLEPAALGIAAITGPHNFNAEDIAEKLLAEQGVVRVDDADELAKVLCQLLQDPEARARLASAADYVLQANRGALARLQILIRPLLTNAEA